MARPFAITTPPGGEEHLPALPTAARPLSGVPHPSGEMREDLASRLAVPVESVTIVSLEEVTWADGCLGVHEPGIVCAQALTPGFLATLVIDGLPWSFAYHGSGQTFIPAPFIQDATLGAPFE